MSTEIKFVFRDEGGGTSPPPEAVGGTADRRRPRRPSGSGDEGGSTSPSPKKELDPVTAAGEAIAGKLIVGIATAMGRVPVFGQISKLLTDIARHTKILEILQQAGGSGLRDLLGQILGGGGRRSGGGGAGRVIDSRVVDGSVVGRYPTTPPAGPGIGGSAGGAAGGVGRGLISASAGAARGGAVAAGGGTGGGLAVSGGAAAAGGGAAAAGIATAGIALLVIAAIAALVITIKALIAVNEALKKHFAEVTERLKPFSGALQGAAARADIDKLRGDIDAARRIGPALARFNESQSRIDRAVDRIWRAIEGPLLDNVTPLVESAARSLETLGLISEAVSDFGRWTGATTGVLSRLVQVQNDILGQARRDENTLPPEADILGAFNRKPDLTVTWNGMKFGPNDDFAINDGEGINKFQNPLPKVGVP